MTGRYLNISWGLSLNDIIACQKSLFDLFRASDIDSELSIAGRILLNLWRLMRSELTLTQYSFENVMFSIFKKRLPKFTHENLTKLWCSNHTRWIVVDYFTQRTIGNVKILEKTDLIGRTSELAKLFGIQFLEVLTRGSQFRVESIMLRLVRAKNFVPVSPTVQVLYLILIHGAVHKKYHHFL